MVELAVRDGWPPPADLPRGECICTRLDDGDIHIDHADPRILISAELLDIVAAPSDGTWLEHGARLDIAGCTIGHGWVGAVLKINAVNRTVIYRITDYVPQVNGYIGQWPD